MAHRLSIRQDGTVEMAYAGETPWHGLGVQVADAMTAEEALKKASMDWKVVKRPSLYIAQSGEIKGNAGYNTLIREDSGDVLHVAKASYEPFQNREAFEFADDLLATKDAKFLTCGALDGGRKVWLLAELSRCPLFVAGDEIRPYFLLHNAHDGTSKVRGILTPTRVVCWNTLSAAVAGAKATEGFALRHTAGIRNSAVEARRALGLIAKGFEQLGEKFNALAGKSFSDQALSEYVGEILPAPVKGGDRALEANKSRREIAVRLAHQGKGNDRDGVRGTWWAAYNGMTEFLDHAGNWRSNENRMKDSIFGNRAAIKAEALTLALEYAGK